MSAYRLTGPVNQTQPYPPAIALMGSTASGKTRLAVALAQALNGEIIQRGFGARLSQHGHRHRKDHPAWSVPKLPSLKWRNWAMIFRDLTNR